MAIAVDAMGGDVPLVYPIAGAVQAVNDFGIDVVLVGEQGAIESELQKYQYPASKIEVVHCTESVGMDESPVQALRQKKDSSIRVALNLHRDQQVDAVVTAGSTGAAMATAKFVLKTIHGIDRPAIGTLVPSAKGSFVLLDVGANSDCKPHYLLQFALMGDAYARCALNLSSPRIGLLNNGEERLKGNALARETYQLLEKSSLQFIGNIEGKTMYHGDADVIVCDGFVGNVTLKVAEGTFEFVKFMLKEEIEKSILSKLGYLLMKSSFEGLRARADYNEIGGAPLLGVRGIVTICHGASKAYSIRNAIRHAKECVDLGLNRLIEERVADNLKLLEEAQTNEDVLAEKNS